MLQLLKTLKQAFIDWRFRRAAMTREKHVQMGPVVKVPQESFTLRLEELPNLFKETK
jgi:hypothetical protein